MLLLAWGAYKGAAAYWARSCRLAQSQRRWEDLEATARRWSEWDPGLADPWLYLADAVQHQQRYSEAADYLRRVAPDSPKAVPALLARCRLLFGPANQPVEGEQACLRLLEIEPRATDAHKYLVQYYALTLQKRKLQSQLREAIRWKREPREGYVYHFLIDTVRLANGEQMNSLWLRAHPGHELFSVARLLHAEEGAPVGDADSGGRTGPTISEKERQANTLLETFPHNANLLAYLIDEEIARGHLDRVLELLKQAPQEAELDNRFWRFKGWVHYVKGEIDEAERAYRRALEILPLDWMAMNRLSEVLRIRQKLDDVNRLQDLVERAQRLRTKIRELPAVEQIPNALLAELGRLARDADDDLIARALIGRLGPLDAHPASLLSPKRNRPHDRAVDDR